MNIMLATIVKGIQNIAERAKSSGYTSLNNGLMFFGKYGPPLFVYSNYPQTTGAVNCALNAVTGYTTQKLVEGIGDYLVPTPPQKTHRK